MMYRDMGVWVVVLAAMVSILGTPAVADEALDKALDKAFDTLQTYNWGDDRGTLGAIDDAVAAAHKKADAQKALETRLVAVLKAGDTTTAGKDFACRKLSLIGSAESVAALAALLPDEKLSHMGRYALERMPCQEAVKAMRDALAKVKGKTKIGVINSLGVRRDTESLPALTALVKGDDKDLATAAAAALGALGTPEAAKALQSAPESLGLALADAQLTCAERLLADKKKLEAITIYKALAKSKAKHVKVAAMRGMLAAAGKK